MRIIYSSLFERSFQKLPESLFKDAKKREGLFRKNPFDSRLKTHKLKGKQRELWSFSISYKHRIVFRFLDEKTAYFVAVGDHSIYQ